MDVLFTGPGRHPGQIVGRSQFLQPIHITGSVSLSARNGRCESVTFIQLVVRNPCPGETQRLTQIAGSLAPSANPTNGGKAITVQFNDNMLLPLLLGDHDRHLVRIEQALGVRLSCRGNRVAIAGDSARVDAAQGALQGLWRRLERGESVAGPKSRRRSAWSKSNRSPAAAVGPAGHPHPQGRGGTAQPGPGAVYGGVGLARDGVRRRTGRHRQDLSRGGAGGGDAAGGGSIASCCRAPRSRPASGSAFCRAT